MGRPKLLLSYGGGTVLGSLVAALSAARVEPIVVVASAGDAELRAWCETAAGVITALNPRPERGMLSSILEGLEALGGAAELAGHEEPLLVTPGDLPALHPTTVAELLRRRQATGAGLALPVYRGRRGHPLAISAALIPEIPRLDPARGLHQLLNLYPEEVLRVEVDDPGCVADLDVPEDYERLREGD
jgi:molybdenum cofactor cytidylyltransferase